MTFIFNEKIKKAKTAEAQIKNLGKTYKFCLGLIQTIQVGVGQSVALYEVKF